MPQKKTFEEDLKELENIVTEMEDGELDLASMVKKYTQGMKLAAKCAAQLEKTEKAMDKLVQEKDGRIVSENLVIEGE